MARKTIDFGIDLGTTNSVIACMDRGELVIIRNHVTSSEVTPSAVRMDARGTVIVGQNAYNELELDPENTVAEFKRWLGNPGVDGFSFQRAGKRMTAADLSAEVLKVLRNNASVRFPGEPIGAAVITVPAHFLIPACEDTRVAAQRSGIEIGPFLQEPVAAALAYEYKAEGLEGKLLVFDLGGGTFDASILSAQEGKLIVLGLDGDDKLGGKDYDWALVDVMVHRLQHQYGELALSRGNLAAKRAMAVLKAKAEEGKKTLSALEKASIEITSLGPGFDQVDTIVELTRAELQKATEELTARCISICRRLLTQCHLTRDDLASVLVVGGQTQTPYIREAMLSEFGKAEFRLDPLTVVAAGAALYASMQRLPRSSQAARVPGTVSLQISYLPIVPDEDADVGIAVDPAPASGATVTIVRTDHAWSSGAIPLPPSGKLSTIVVLRSRCVNTFEIQLSDVRGSRIETLENTFTITQGLVPPQATLSRSLAVATVDNIAEILIHKGSPLPAKGTWTFLTAHDVIAGDPRSVLRIFFLEGEHPRSDRNIAIGSCELSGRDLRRTLVGGQEVEITCELTEDKTISGHAFFPAVDEICPMVKTWERPELSPLEIGAELKKERYRLEEIRSVASEDVDPWIGSQIIRSEHDMEAAAHYPDVAQSQAQRILELKADLDELSQKFEWEILARKLNNYREPARELTRIAGTAAQAKAIEDAIGAAEDSLARKDTLALKSAMDALKEAYWETYWDQEEPWEEYLRELSQETDFTEPVKAQRLKQEGQRALQRDDTRTVRNTVRRLHALLPKSKLDERFSGEILSPR